MSSDTSAPEHAPEQVPVGVRMLHQDTAERPFIVFWEITKACGLACRHCRASAVPQRHPLELTTEEGMRVIDDLAALGSPRPILVLTGGDPFERADLIDLVRHADSQGLPVALSPSVTPNLTRERLAALHQAGAGAISLSLDGARPETHDGIRRIEGVHRATLVAAAMVRELGYRLQVNTTVHADNVHELPDLLAWLIDADVSLWSVFLLVPTGRGAELAGLTSDQVEDVLHWLHDIGELVPVKTTEAPQFRRVAMQRAGVADIDALFPPGPLRGQLRQRTSELVPASHALRHRRRPLSVNAGRGVAFIDHCGTIYPSGFLPLAVGSVRERPLSAWYRDSPLMNALRDPDHFTGKCAVCEFRRVCGGSRSRAFATTGDPLGDDPACDYVPAGWLGTP
ncbi:MAG: TIGR04053 family radical SAM/SPASM domain-containing protein [Actinomycetota bacterium]|nr:TIGR04053 family radical SAM/SPASM domain-containing protein [Actinomycetota bacterium]